MSLAAIGCNPLATTVEADHALGSIGYSPAGGLYVYVQAGNACAVNKLCAIEPGYQLLQRDSADAHQGASLGATEVAFANDDYGWAKVWGIANLTAGGAITAGMGLALDASETGDVVNGTSNEPQIIGAMPLAAIADNATGGVQLAWPVLRLTT